ncbi:MAG: DUF1566 domain-containing protein [Alistipes sp.]|nr:DUF1566 domain-containing protein [Alistipes sp.]
MKRLLLLLLCFVVPVVAMAQMQRTFEIDAESFAPVQQGALSGVAIDKIQLDHSKRPCARIKLLVDRMSREDIANINVKIVGGNVALMKREVAIEGNGLIIELTAKSQTRFYLHHDKFGNSNEVILNLEGDTEYRLDARLNYLQPIVIITDVVGADVYVDKEYFGVTGADYVLPISGVTLGVHNIRIVYGTEVYEQLIEVRTDNIYHKVSMRGNLPQDVAMQSVPSYYKSTYKVGDYYDDGTKQGVVFYVDSSGKHGKIVSLDQVYTQWCTKAQYKKKIVVGASSKSDGKANTDKVMSRSDSAEYPAFVWCRAKGQDWYLPAFDELKLLLLDSSVHEAVNSTLNERGGNTFFGWYWSSTEYNKFCAWDVVKYGGSTGNYYKSYNVYVRAVSAF